MSRPTDSYTSGGRIELGSPIAATTTVPPQSAQESADGWHASRAMRGAVSRMCRIDGLVIRLAGGKPHTRVYAETGAWKGLRRLPTSERLTLGAKTSFVAGQERRHAAIPTTEMDGGFNEVGAGRTLGRRTGFCIGAESREPREAAGGRPKQKTKQKQTRKPERTKTRKQQLLGGLIPNLWQARDGLHKESQKCVLSCLLLLFYCPDAQSRGSSIASSSASKDPGRYSGE
jgi:hypothetical protein